MSLTLKSFYLLAAIGINTGLYSASATSDTITIPLGQQGDFWNVERPAKGMSQAQVESKYGEPLEKSAAVGKPPITTWTYTEFYVYFEYDHVIHSVVIANPKQ
ncbi:MAG: hypothetical protein U5M23_02730 [Marinagarivorans sp.]|nr:hypothetical protein [Marinagarivorans sp.]